MGILNVTPDSFFKESRVTPESAPSRISKMLDEGADIIDIGAVSTRPGAGAVPVEEEWRRLEPVLGNLPGGLSFSLDTTSSEIVRRAYELSGPFWVNDISSGEDDPEMLPIVADLGLKYVAMHKRGTPSTMDAFADYPESVVRSVYGYFEKFSINAAMFGIADWILDPGFGFAKTDAQNMELLESLSVFRNFGRPVLAGISEKRFTHGNTQELQQTAVRNGADIIRVHDVAAAVKSLRS